MGLSPWYRQGEAKAKYRTKVYEVNKIRYTGQKRPPIWYYSTKLFSQEGRTRETGKLGKLGKQVNREINHCEVKLPRPELISKTKVPC